MLFTLSEHTKQKILSNDIDEKIEIIINNIATMLLERNNIFFTTRPVLETIITSPHFYNSTKHYFKSYIEDLLEIKELLNKVSVYCEICVFHEHISFRENHNQKIIIIPGEFIRLNKYTQPTSLIFEDFYDIDFITKISRVLNKKFKIYKYDITYEEDSGNGARTGETLKRKVLKNKNFCYCLVDTDKNHPLKKITDSPTYKSVRNTNTILMNLGYSNYLIDALDCHEIENIIPIHFLHSLFGDNIDYSNRISSYCEIFKLNYEYRHYFDFKKGITGKIIKHELSTKQYFWTKALDHVDIDYLPDCVNDEKYIDRTFLHGTPDYLSKSLKFLEENHDKIESTINFEEEIYDFWIKISRNLFSTCCAYRMSS